jgi:hypothetical protein
MIWPDFGIWYGIIYQNYFTMSNLLYIIAVILVIGWAIGFFAYTVGSVIHILLVLAVISLIIGIIRRPTTY